MKDCRRCGKQEVASDDGRLGELKLHESTRSFLLSAEWCSLCDDCLRDIDQKVVSMQGHSLPGSADLEEGVHYYLEDGTWVFTELYHMLRGYCCKSGCRHCAYGWHA